MNEELIETLVVVGIVGVLGYFALKAYKSSQGDTTSSLLNSGSGAVSSLLGDISDFA